MWLRTVLAAGLLLITVSTSSSAEPMRLDDPTPRWVVVQFENSPSEHPQRLDNTYTRPFLAWLEPNDLQQITVRVAAEVLEQSLFRERDPVPGSFSDYVWVFDQASGDVLSASFSGAFSYAFDWGFATSEIHAHVRAEMQTTEVGGFRGARPVWGQRLYPWCNDVEDRRCTGVPTSAYDSERGYVNAVGFLAIDSPLTQFATYSAVGEARFSEAPQPAQATLLAPDLSELDLSELDLSELEVTELEVSELDLQEEPAALPLAGPGSVAGGSEDPAP